MLGALLPRAVGEGRRVALVSGEPGSGKSRLVRELAEQLSRDGAAVLYGGCDAVFRVPYGPFAEALGSLIRDAEAASPGSADAGGHELARLVPGLREDSVSLSALSATDAEAERHRLHTAVVDLLTAAGARAPTLLVLEDLHWADVSTLLLLRHLVRSASGSRMLLVGTFRDVEADVPAALSETLAELARSEGVIPVRLGGLDDGDVAEFLRLTTGVEPDSAVTAEIAELTNGNAFLLTELWRELVDSDAVEVTAQRVRLIRPLVDVATPETVRQVVAQRIARLEPTTAEVLQLGAVAGSAFELDTIRRAATLSEGELLDGVDEAVRSGLVVEAPGRGLAYRFAHELVRRSVIDQVSASRRAELHLRVARAHREHPGERCPFGPARAAGASLRRGCTGRGSRARRVVRVCRLPSRPPPRSRSTRRRASCAQRSISVWSTSASDVRSSSSSGMHAIVRERHSTRWTRSATLRRLPASSGTSSCSRARRSGSKRHAGVRRSMTRAQSSSSRKRWPLSAPSRPRFAFACSAA